LKKLKSLKILGLLIGIISFNGCGSAFPKKPMLESGILILESNEVFFVNNQTSEERSIPIFTEGSCTINPELNKTSIHSNEDWNLVLLYVRLLESRISNKRVRDELKKIRDSHFLLNKRAKLYGL
jgi:hypothetical protein